MRDLSIAFVIIGFVPLVLKYPWTGVLLYAWVSLFSPHRFAWGFAYDFQFALVAGIATLVGMALHRKEARLPFNSVTILLVLLPLWMTVTLLFALEPHDAYVRWEEVMKIFFFALIAASLLHTRRQLETFLWVIVLSIGFYGVKGGIFTLLSGGGEKVYGPPGTSFLSDNNAIAAALIMTIPLMHYLGTTVSSRWMKAGIYGAMLLCAMAVLGTQSRGAFLGISVMGGFLWLKSGKKLVSGIVLLSVAALAIGFMPQEWASRMGSIEKYEQDTSALGRLNAWHMAFNLANDRPLVGGGFEPYTPRTFAMYAPDPSDLHSAHSIYFQMLGEHGYVGLLLFLALGVAAWRTAQRIVTASRSNPEYAREGNLARAIQVSLIGYASAGAFVNIGYWDFVYYEIVVLMATYRSIQVLESQGHSSLEPKTNILTA
jgi:probable O-glycosylation ligase (exosortase A-associated)